MVPAIVRSFGHGGILSWRAIWLLSYVRVSGLNTSDFILNGVKALTARE